MNLKPRSAADLLAIVLCPAGAFGDGAAEVLLPMKACLIRRFRATRARRARQ